MRNSGLGAFLCIALAACGYGNTIAVWNFNDAVSGMTGGAQEFLVDYGNGTMTSNFSSSSIGNSPGSTLNAQPGDPAGQALRLSGSGNNGRYLSWMIDTTGFESIDVSFAIQRTTTGFSGNQFLYSLDAGFSWENFGSAFSPGTSFGLQSFDLSGIQELNNNPGAGFGILLDGATSATGNSKIDNLVVSGVPIDPPIVTPVPEPSSLALTGIGLACGLICLCRRNPRGKS